MARTLGSAIVARGVLELLWDHCYESGEDYVGTSDDIEAIVGWTAERGAVTRALADAGAPEGYGFLEPISELGSVPGLSPDLAGQVRYRVHDLWQHAPEYVSNRRAREDERRKCKTCAFCGRKFFSADNRAKFCSGACKQGGWRSAHSSDAPARETDKDRPLRNTLRTETDRNGTPAPAPAPARAQKSVSPEPLRASVPSVQPPPTFLEFQVVGTGGELWRLTEAQVSDWQRLFPTVNVRQEMRHALAWVLANPGRKKTGRGMPKFLTGWLTRATDRRGGSGPSSTSRLAENGLSHRSNEVLQGLGRRP